MHGNRCASRRIRWRFEALVPSDRGIKGDGSNGWPEREIARLQAFLGDGARRIQTADLLGAIQALCQLSYSPGLWRDGKLLPLPRKRQDNPIVFESLLRERPA